MFYRSDIPKAHDLLAEDVVVSLLPWLHVVISESISNTSEVEESSTDSDDVPNAEDSAGNDEFLVGQLQMFSQLSGISGLPTCVLNIFGITLANINQQIGELLNADSYEVAICKLKNVEELKHSSLLCLSSGDILQFLCTAREKWLLIESCGKDYHDSKGCPKDWTRDSFSLLEENLEIGFKLFSSISRNVELCDVLCNRLKIFDSKDSVSSLKLIIQNIRRFKVLYDN